MPQIQQLKDIKNLSHKTVIVRADFNVPLDKGMVTDPTRINRGAATIQYLLQQKAKVVIISHLGRPDGQPNPAYSLQQVIPSLKKSLHGHDVFFVDDCVGTKVEEKVKGLKNGQVLLLENLRFYAAEEKNDPLFAQKLALLGDIYVNDAFSCAHRAHASIDRITQLLPSVAGLLLSEEINALEQTLHNPKRPLTAIVGGAKISTKLLLLQNLLSKVDYLVVGGAMANTFLLGQGYKIGKSLVEPTMVATVLDVIKLAANTRKALLLPVDAVLAKALVPHTPTRIAAVTDINSDEMILDIGPKTIDLIIKTIQLSKNVVWNGPLGAFETKPFDRGTITVAQAIADATKQGTLTSVAGGGDTVSALGDAGVEDKFSYVSSAGGAFLEWLEGKELPGIVALKNSRT